MGRCTTAIRRWPRDQKSKPEVTSRDVIKWTAEAVRRFIIIIIIIIIIINQALI